MRSRSASARPSLHFWVLAGFFALLAITGGGSRADAPMLVVLRPASCLLFAFALWSVTRAQFVRYWPLIALLAASFGLTLLHLVPLPPAIWGALPGREMIVAVDQVSGLAPLWRPLSLTPADTLNALFSLFAPAAVLLIAIQLDTVDHRRTLLIVLALVVATTVTGLLQAIRPDGGADVGVNALVDGGLFTNRNHQALLLAAGLPMLAVFATAQPSAPAHEARNRWLAVGAAILIIPLILITGSRIGVVAAVLALALVPLHLAPPGNRTGAAPRTSGRLRQFVGIAVGVIVLGMATAMAARAEALDRLLSGVGDVERVSIWQSTYAMTLKYLPFGSGIGSFVPIYKIDEPVSALASGYVNHAHNDLLELALTGGIPALMIAGIAIGAWGRSAWQAFRSPQSRRRTAFQRLGVSVIGLFALGSIADYPMRTPTIMCIVALAAVWAARPGATQDNDA